MICKTGGVRPDGGMRLAMTLRMLITALVLSSLVAAPLAMALAPGRFAPLLALWPAALFVVLAALLPEVTAGHAVVETSAWVGSLGIDLSPLLAILLLQFTNQFLVQSLHELAQRMG